MNDYTIRTNSCALLSIEDYGEHLLWSLRFDGRRIRTVFNILEQFRRETGQTTEMQLFTIGERVANLKRAIVWQTDNVACPRFVNSTLALSHKLRWRGETESLAMAHMQIGFVAFKLTATHLAECYA